MVMDRNPSSSAAVVVLPSSQLEVLPRHALVLLAGIPEEEGRVEGGNQDRGAVRMHAAAELTDRLARAEKTLGRDAAERQDDLGLEHGELRGEEGRARGDLVAGQLDLPRLEHLRQELSGPPDKGKPLGVLVRAGAFADDDELRSRIARSEHDRRASFAELAQAAPLDGLLLGAERLGGARQVVAAEQEVREPEIAMMAESLAERAERVGEQGTRVGGRHAS